jgi:hypothetical protein
VQSRGARHCLGFPVPIRRWRLRHRFCGVCLYAPSAGERA